LKWDIGGWFASVVLVVVGRGWRWVGRVEDVVESDVVVVLVGRFLFSSREDRRGSLPKMNPT
jgi:hypothetical protein